MDLNLAHIGVYVHDLERSVRFYQDVLDFVQIFRYENQGTPIAFLQNGTCVLELIEKPASAGRTDGRVDHIALAVTDLAQAHRRTNEALAEARRQKELEETRRTQEEFGKRLKKLERDFDFESGGLLIRPARSHAELIDEGSALHHCVATYAKKHLSGQTVIFFIREKSEPDKPFYTLEYNPKTESIVQCRGLHNCSKTPEVEAFVEAWSGYIRNKKKKSHAAA